MKTDKEMAHDILCKINNIKRERIIMKKRFYKITAISCAFALVFVLAFALFNINGKILPDNSNSTTGISESSNAHLNKNFFVMVANAAYDTETFLNKKAGLTVPLGGILMVKDTKNKTDSEKDAVIQKLKSRLTDLYGKDKGWHISGEQGETTIYFGTADYLKLKIEDSNCVEKITLSCTENGKLTISDKSIITSPSKYIKTVKQGTSITLTGKEYKETYEKENGMRLEWFLSESMLNTFKAAPETALSSVSDEINITINFIDGTEETFTIVLKFDDEGMLTSSFKA